MKKNPYQTKSDSALVQCFLGGDNRCFTELVSRHHPHVHNLLHYKMHNATLEKDAEQETFIILSIEIRNGTTTIRGILPSTRTSGMGAGAHAAAKENHYVHDSTALSNDRAAHRAGRGNF
jgi:hypothetical protein